MDLAHLHRPQLIALDWGTSSLRAYRMSGDCQLLETRSLPLGIMRLENSDTGALRDGIFESALHTACGDWLEALPAVPVIASGMVGSAQGWREAPYLPAPLALDQLGCNLTPVSTSGGRTIFLIPGVVQRMEPVNVMRGEETQIVGALAASSQQDGQDSIVALPGTHSKWVVVNDGRIQRFETFLTGELYSALCAHTILGRTMQPGTSSLSDAFDRGVQAAARAAAKGGLLSTIFSVRALGLTGALPATKQGEYLSGLLIGDEIAAIVRLFSRNGHVPPILLIGDEVLCSLYQRALDLRGIDHAVSTTSASQKGLWRVAVQAGLVSNSYPPEDRSC